ncbi:hypothetical protein [Streptomyces sp. NPDC002845]
MDLLELLGIAAGSLLMIGALARGGWAVLRRLVFIGEAVKELAPNGGESMKDQVSSTARDMGEMKEAVTELTRRFDEHLAEHARTTS